MTILDAALAGYFMGEGCLDLFANQYGHVRPRARVGARADDVAVLEQFRARFGGRIYSFRPTPVDSYTRNPQCRWELTGARAVAGLIEVLETCPLSSNKNEQAHIMRRVLGLLGGRQGCTPKPGDEISRLRTSLAVAKRFKSKRLESEGA